MIMITDEGLIYENDVVMVWSPAMNGSHSKRAVVMEALDRMLQDKYMEGYTSGYEDGDAGEESDI